MSFFSWLFGRRKINIIAPYDTAKGKMIVTHTAKLKCRPAHNIPIDLRDELIAICADNKCVSACYFLDVLETPTSDIKLFVDLSLDQPNHDLDIVAPLMQKVFSKHPEYTNRFFIGADFVHCPTKAAAYQRRTV